MYNRHLFSYSRLLTLFCSNPYSKLPAPAQVGNSLGITLVVLAGTVLFVVSNAAFRRVNVEDDRVAFVNDGE